MPQPIYSLGKKPQYHWIEEAWWAPVVAEILIKHFLNTSPEH
jgi:hypothetical protein